MARKCDEESKGRKTLRGKNPLTGVLYTDLKGEASKSVRPCVLFECSSFRLRQLGELC
jgi:hypothetical protein